MDEDEEAETPESNEKHPVSIILSAGAQFAGTASKQKVPFASLVAVSLNAASSVVDKVDEELESGEQNPASMVLHTGSHVANEAAKLNIPFASVVVAGFNIASAVVEKVDQGIENDERNQVSKILSAGAQIAGTASEQNVPFAGLLQASLNAASSVAEKVDEGLDAMESGEGDPVATALNVGTQVFGEAAKLGGSFTSLFK